MDVLFDTPHGQHHCPQPRIIPTAQDKACINNVLHALSSKLSLLSYYPRSYKTRNCRQNKMGPYKTFIINFIRYEIQGLIKASEFRGAKILSGGASM